MQKLNEEYLRQNGWPEKTRIPEKVLQFGEGNFLRGFVDWMINKLNRITSYNVCYTKLLR